MEHPTPPPPEGPAYSAAVRGIAAASVALGYFSLIVFFWKPFGMLLGAVGLTLGLVSVAIGNRGGLRGENVALAGVGICAVSLSITTALYWGVGFMTWGYTFW
jgi:hypothetical protein